MVAGRGGRRGQKNGKLEEPDDTDFIGLLLAFSVLAFSVSRRGIEMSGVSIVKGLGVEGVA